MFYLVTYDINQGHAKVKEECMRAGFFGYVQMPDGSCKELPNTTLIVEADTAFDAVNKFRTKAMSVVDDSLCGSLISPPVKMKIIAVRYTEHSIENDETLLRSKLPNYTDPFMEDSRASVRHQMESLLLKNGK
jgi:hypothetical protein